MSDALIPTSKRYFTAAAAMEAASRGLPKELRLMVKLRASFLNNCSFCINMHTKEALSSGFTEQRVEAIRHWSGESPENSGTATESTVVFAADELLVLEFTTAGTLLPEDSVSDDLRQRVLDRFGRKRAGELVATIATINMWNRIGVLTGK